MEGSRGYFFAIFWQGPPAGETVSSRHRSGGTKFEELHRKLKAQDEEVRLLKDRLNRTLEDWPGRRAEGTHGGGGGGGRTHGHFKRSAEEKAVEPVRESTKMIFELQDTVKDLSAQNVELKRSLRRSEHEREIHQLRDETDAPSRDTSAAVEQHKSRLEAHSRRSRSRQSGADSAVALSGEEGIGSPELSHSPPTAVTNYSARLSTREILQTHEARASKYGLRQPTIRPPTIPTPVATPCGDRYQSLAELSINLTPTPGGKAFCEHLVDPNDC